MASFIHELYDSGVPVDLVKLNELILRLEKEKAIIEKRINDVLDSPIDFNFWENLAFVLYENGLYPEELSYDYFKKHKTENEIYHLLYQHKKVSKNGKLITNIKNNICDDGRLRGTWKLNGSQTKRLSCSKPNLMALPKSVAECIIPNDDNVIIKCDYSQIELKILAELTQDNNLIKAFNTGDIHSSTASLIYNKPVEKITKQERASCKAINYGIIYGISAVGLKNALEKIEINIKLSKAAQLRNRFLNVFAGVSDYRKECCTADELSSLGGTKINAEAMSVNQRLNWAIQTSCSEILLTSINYLMINKAPSTRLINSIHDELWIESQLNNLELEKNTLISSMRYGFEKYINSVDFSGDIEIIERN